MRPLNYDLIRKQSDEVYRFRFLSTGLLLSLAYLLVLPIGLTGLLLTIIALAFVLAGVGKKSKSIGVFLLLFGSGTFGMVFQSFGIRYAGTLLAVPIGLILIFPTLPGTAAWLSSRWRSPVAWLLVMAILMVFFYFRGPQTEYCQTKLAAFLVWLPIAVIALGCLVKSRAVSMWDVGLLGVVSSVVYYGAMLHMYPEVVPSSIWVTAGVRFSSESAGQRIMTNNLGFGSIYGSVLLIGSIIDARLTRKSLFILGLALGVGLLILNSAGQRLFWVVLPVSIFPMALYRSQNRALTKGVLCVLLIAVVVVICVGLRTQNDYVTRAFGRDVQILDRFNRSTNWLAAFPLIASAPMFGHGLGGYYIDGQGFPGDGLYAHNLFLELLSETGIIGTAVLLSPVIFLLVIPKWRRMLALRAANGGTLLPLLVAVFLHGMISYDLTHVYRLFAILAVYWGCMGSNRPVGRDVRGCRH